MLKYKYIVGVCHHQKEGDCSTNID